MARKPRTYVGVGVGPASVGQVAVALKERAPALAADFAEDAEPMLGPGPIGNGNRLAVVSAAPARPAAGAGSPSCACSEPGACASLARTRWGRQAFLGPLAPLLHALADAPTDDDTERVARARRLLEEAIARGREPAIPVGGPSTAPKVGLKVDKYFGAKLPPVCAQLGCYVTDDGKRFYCVNPACQKHKKRETKHTRRGNPEKPHFVYFKCPRCKSRSVEMNLLSNRYACKTCKYVWER